MKRDALKKLFHLYNEQGLTSIADRNAGRETLDLYRALRDRGELTVRVNVARSFDPYRHARGGRATVRRAAGQGRPGRPDRRRRRLGAHRPDQALPRRRHAQRHAPTCASPGRKGPHLPDRRRRLSRPAVHPAGAAAHGGRGGGEAQMADDRPHRRRRGDGRAARRLRVREPRDADQGPALLHHARQLPVAAQPGALQGSWASAPTCSRPGSTRTATTLQRVLGDKRMRWFQPYKTLAGVHDHRRRQRPHGQAGFAGGDQPVEPVAGHVDDAGTRGRSAATC